MTDSGQKKRRLGRPRKPVADVKSKIVHVRITPGEQRALKIAARKAGCPVRDYVRDRLTS